MSTTMLNDQTFTSTAIPKSKASSDTMSFGGVAIKTFVYIVVALIFGGIGWDRAGQVLETTSGIWFLLGYMALIAMTVAASQNPAIALAVGFIYAIVMGLWMGSISRIYEAQYEGIVAQALLASVAALVACLVLYMTGIVKPTGKLVRIVIAATLGICLMYFAAWILSIFGADCLMIDEPNALGIALSIGICLVAAANLFVDFAMIEHGTKSGAPKGMEWYCAFGILSTLVWLYMEVLRLIALLRRAQ